MSAEMNDADRVFTSAKKGNLLIPLLIKALIKFICLFL